MDFAGCVAGSSGILGTWSRVVGLISRRDLVFAGNVRQQLLAEVSVSRNELGKQDSPNERIYFASERPYLEGVHDPPISSIKEV
jgi:hypothetical protein